MQQGGGESNFAAAHERLVSDPTLQFAFSAPPPRRDPPSWLKPLGDLLEAIAPFAQYVFWGLLIVGALLIAVYIAREIINTRWKRAPRPVQLTTGVAEWRPEPARAKALLEEADRLAAQGRFAEAAHVLLLRSIDDFHGRRPDLVRPALTSRDISGLKALPDAARPAFRFIAEMVERSLFGGRPVDADGYGRCRQAYEDFALPRVWS
jgi:hypothetical protein